MSLVSLARGANQFGSEGIVEIGAGTCPRSGRGRPSRFSDPGKLLELIRSTCTFAVTIQRSGLLCGQASGESLYDGGRPSVRPIRSVRISNHQVLKEASNPSASAAQRGDRQAAHRWLQFKREGQQWANLRREFVSE